MKANTPPQIDAFPATSKNRMGPGMNMVAVVASESVS